VKDSLYFSVDEKATFERILRQGLLQPSNRGHYWWVLRLAMARSLQDVDEPDDRYRAQSSKAGGSELHLEQVTGFGKDVILDDAFRTILSIRHEQDLFDRHDAYVEIVQRHCRRGLQRLEEDWRAGSTLHDALLDNLYFGGQSEEPSDIAHAASVDFHMLRRGLEQISVSAALQGEAIQGPRLTRFTLTLAGVDDYDRLRKGLDDLAFAIGLGSGGMSLAREPGERRVILDVPRPSATWRDVSWKDVRTVLESALGALPVCPGVDVIGRPMVFDLAEAPHLFVAGATGSGKSVCVNAILLSLLRSPKPPELLMIDPKGVDFADYDGCRLLRGGKVLTDMADAVSALRAVVEEMDSRQAELRERGARNIAEAQASGSGLNRLVVVIDELADFMMSRGGAEEPLIRLAQKSRAVGIHLVLATQRPEAATFPGLLRANIPSRIALTVQKATDSRIILDEGGAEDLMMKGDMLIKLAGRDTIRAHGARVERSDIATAIAQVNSQ
jgi:S-DNA-T family DNA segregation ATPase FtsK/SpoIIIE